MSSLLPYERTKAWREKNKEKHAQQQRRYYLNHKEKIRGYQREYARNRRANAKVQDQPNSEVIKTS